MPSEDQFIQSVRMLLGMVMMTLSLLAVATCFFFFTAIPVNIPEVPTRSLVQKTALPDAEVWKAPDSTLIPLSPEADFVSYGRELISHTALYLGPKGKVKTISNGMNCQNCHLKAGTKPFGNNYAAVASTYPKFRARSGGIESMEKRINDCIERSLNGKKLDTASREMRAIVAYFRWVGKDVKKGEVPKGAGIPQLSFLNRAADPVKGKSVFIKHCVVCHGKDASGYKERDSLEWKYPPLAGPASYSIGAGLYRLSRFAGYVKMNMPHGIYYEKPVLNDEEAWDVAAYINSLPRPKKYFVEDWPDISAKPYDHPFGPYADSFSENQHKYGPFGPIVNAKKNSRVK